MIRKKILLLGDFNVGKTSLIRRYIDKTFSEKYLTTIGVKISKKEIELNHEIYEMLIWDIEGATPQKSIPQSYYNGASGAIFVADISRSDTIEGLDAHIQTFNYLNPDRPYVIAYNKIDLLNEEQQKELPNRHNAFFTSAKTDTQVEELFTHLAQEIFND